MNLFIKLTLSIIASLVLLFIGENAYSAFVLGNQFSASLTTNALTLLWYIVPSIAICVGVVKIWQVK